MDSSVPVVPPRPPVNHHQDSSAPPVPPLPPDFHPEDQYESPPHFADPLAAPRPHKLDPDLPANMARNLDDQARGYQDPFRRMSPQIPQVNYNPGFAIPNRGPSPLPPPQGSSWGAWNTSSPPPQMPYPTQSGPPQRPPPADGLSPAMASLSFNAPPQQALPHHPRAYSTYGPPPKPPSPPRQMGGAPSLTAPLPTIPSLMASLQNIQQPNGDPAVRIAWCRDVLFLADRLQPTASTDQPIGPARITDPQLQRLINVAVPIVLQIASPQPLPSPLPVSMAEAIYLRATFAASGAYPDHVRHNPRSAFRDFEQAARGGYSAAWFRLGRDYENFNDMGHARDCFERGLKLNVESCTYRMGMAHLMGQLGLPPNPERSIPLLMRAATLASLEVPQPAYVFGLLLLSEFSHVTIPPQLFPPYLPQGATVQSEARKHLERAAYLNFAPAQYKLGHAYEFAQPPFPFDPLLSVQYYSLASQQGEIEADMALSKWFLCGAEGSFEKDEALAFTFAEKAARKGLPSAEFAMGYYAEVGVGGPKDIEVARKWYTRAAEHGNTDASERLGALNLPSPQALSRQEHDNLTESKLVRKRTQAKQRSDAVPGAPRPSVENGRQVVDVIRQNSILHQPIPEGAAPPGQVRKSSLGTAQGGPPLSGSNGPSPQGSPQMRPNPGPGQRQFANHHRYTLVDPGSPAVGAQPPSRTQTPQVRPHVGRTASAGQLGGPPQPMDPMEGGPPPAARPPPKGPTTFAEMGIQGAKAEEKECVIM